MVCVCGQQLRTGVSHDHATSILSHSTNKGSRINMGIGCYNNSTAHCHTGCYDVSSIIAKYGRTKFCVNGTNIKR